MFKCIQVGVGGFGKRWLEVLSKSKEAEYAAIVDINRENLQNAIETLKIDPSRAFNNHREGKGRLRRHSCSTSLP